MKSVSILIVEDDPQSAKLLKAILVKTGHRVLDVVDNGVDAIKRAKMLQPQLILMDININGDLDGVQTADMIRKECDVPIIYLSACSDNETIKRAKETNPFGYILKPYTDKEVTITIEMALHKFEIDENLREREHRLALTLNSLPDGIITTDANGIISFMNPASEMMLGVISEKATGQSIENCVLLKRRKNQDAITDLKKFLFGSAHEAHGEQPFVLKSKYDEERLVEVESTPSIDKSGNIVSYVITFHDISDQCESTGSISMMAEALESIHEGVMITKASISDTYPEVIYANKGLENITQYGKNDILGRNFDFLFQDTLPANWLQLLKKCVKENYPLSEELSAMRKDGSTVVVFMSVSVVRGQNNEPTHIVFIVRDISKLRHLEANIQRAQKIEGIGRLAGGIAHDFNNILSVINSYSDLLRLKLGDDCPYIKFVDNIRSSGKKGADLVSQLMTFSRREENSPKVIQLTEVVQQTEQMLQRVIREDIHLKTIYDKDTSPIKADFGQMEQVLMNLCVNARDAMPEGGSITIEVKPQKITLNEEQKKINPKIPGNYVLLKVTDTGTGMDEETKNHIYEPFFTTKDIGKGTGLGLSTVYGIVKQSGGYIDLESELGKGTTFSVYFPAIMNEETVDRPQAEELPASVPRGSEKILIVEDDATFADCLSGVLSLHGYIVHSASEGEEALSQFESHASDIKLLITDLILPKLTGREIASRLMDKNPNLKVIFMTGYDDQVDSFYEIPEKSIFLQKPFSLKTILSKARELLDGTTEVVAKNS